MTARDWLKDEPPMFFDAEGRIHSAFPFEVLGNTCPHCHAAMVKICGLEQCPGGCPAINQWLEESRQKLNQLKAAMQLSERVSSQCTPIAIEIIADPICR